MKFSLKALLTFSPLIAAALSSSCARLPNDNCQQPQNVTPRRAVQQVGDNESVALGQYAVAVAGNGGKAQTQEGGAAITGDYSGALVSKGGVALSGDTGCSIIGDGGMAMTGYRGHAYGGASSAAMVHAGGHAIGDHQSVAMATGGVAEVRHNGVALAGNFPDFPGTFRGIAVAGPCGIAIAWESGVLVRAGTGGAVGGYWGNRKGPQLVIRMVGGTIHPDTFYRFSEGSFLTIKPVERLQAEKDFAEWGSDAAKNCIKTAR